MYDVMTWLVQKDALGEQGAARSLAFVEMPVFFVVILGYSWPVQIGIAFS